METLGQAIKRLRKKQTPKLTVTKLAKDVGVVQSFITEIENDKKFPTIEKFKKISTKLNGGHRLKFLYQQYLDAQKIDATFLKKIKSRSEWDFLKDLLFNKALSSEGDDLDTFSEELILEYTPEEKDNKLFRSEIFKLLKDSNFLLQGAIKHSNANIIKLTDILFKKKPLPNLSEELKNLKNK